MNTLIGILSQISKPVIKIENILIICIVISFIALLRNWMKIHRYLLTICVAIICLITYTPPIQFLVMQLENRFPAPRLENLQTAGGIILLGGALLEGVTPVERDQTLINENAERLTSALMLMKQNPNLDLVYSTFSGQFIIKGITEDKAAERFFTEQGVPNSRLQFEKESRNTYENALESLKLVNPENRPWILITSATHMARAVIAFERVGWTIIPYPVDYQTGTLIDFKQFSPTIGIKLWNRWI